MIHSKIKIALAKADVHQIAGLSLMLKQMHVQSMAGLGSAQLCALETISSSSQRWANLMLKCSSKSPQLVTLKLSEALALLYIAEHTQLIEQNLRTYILFNLKKYF